MADIVSRFSKKFEEYANSIGKLVAEVRKTQQQFGIAAGQAASLKIDNFLSSVSSYMGSLMSGFSKAGATAQEIQAAQADFQSEFGGVLTSKAATDLAVQAKEMGVTTAQLAQARRVFMTQTGGNLSDATSAQAKFIGEFQKKGLTSKDAMLAISQNSELLARNGTRFATSFARAAADAKKIGVDLSKVDQVGDSIIGDFEGFLEKQAELGAMGFNFDSNKIAQVAESGDTGALFNELRSQLAATGKDITKLRRSEQLALSGAFGIPMAELQRMAGPTGGSGEELTDQEKTNSFLERLVNGGEFAAKLLGAMATALAVVHTALLTRIAINTGKFGDLKTDVKTLFGGVKNMLPKAASGVKNMIPRAASGIRGMSTGARVLGGAGVGMAGAAVSAGGEMLKSSGYEKTGSAVSTLGSIAQYAGIGMMFGPVGAAVGALVGAVIGIAQNFDGWKQMAGAVFNGMISAISWVGESLFSAGKWILDAFMKFNPVSIIYSLLTKGFSGTSGAEKSTAKFGDDVTSRAGYGSRALVTPTHTIALNNQDNVVSYADDMISQNAGINLLSKGSIAENAAAGTNQPITVDLSKLEAKLDQMVERLAGMGVYMDGSKVGKMLHNSNDKQSVGMMRQQALQSV